MIQFYWPWLLLLLPAPWLLGLIWPRRDNNAAALNMSFANQLPAYSAAASGESKAKQPGWWLAWALLLLAASRPQWVGEPIALPNEGRDLMLAVDVSGSMQELDMRLGGQRMNRLQAVQLIASDFIERRTDDRVGLILFGDNAYLQSPLSFDRKTVAELLKEAVIGIAGEQRTAVGDAIGLALKRMRQGVAEGEEPHLLILLTDGESNAGIDPVKAAKLAADSGMRIYTIGFGSGKGRRSGIDENALEQVAQLTGGRYFRAHNTRELKRIYALVDEIESVEDEGRQFRPVRDVFYWPLLAACFVLLLSLFVERYETKSMIWLSDFHFMRPDWLLLLLPLAAAAWLYGRRSGSIRSDWHKVMDANLYARVKPSFSTQTVCAITTSAVDFCIDCDIGTGRAELAATRLAAAEA